ncbi:MAG: hypothetical protein VKP72_00480 [bacterium]|nr:hypothetical protein [bacterium]
MHGYWVTVSVDDHALMSHCYEAVCQEAAVARMITYLELEFDLPRHSPVQIRHHD